MSTGDLPEYVVVNGGGPAVYVNVATAAGGGVTLQSVLAEARALVHRLGDREKSTDGLVETCESLNSKVSGMKEYQADLYELSMKSGTGTGPRARASIVQSLQQENRQIRELREDNHQLKVALEEHQVVLEALMQQHRKQMSQIMKVPVTESLSKHACQHVLDCEFQMAEQLRPLQEFGHVFGDCLRMGEESSIRDQELMARLRTENQTLRELLKLAAPNDPVAVQKYMSLRRKPREKIPKPPDDDDDHGHGNGDSTPTGNMSPPETPENTSPVKVPSFVNELFHNANFQQKLEEQQRKSAEPEEQEPRTEIGQQNTIDT